MPVLHFLGGGRRPNVLSLLAVGLVVAGMLMWVNQRRSAGARLEATPCADGFVSADCAPGADRLGRPEQPATLGPVVKADQACRDAGYLCAALDTAQSILVMHWKGFHGTLVIRVPEPSFEDAGTARRLQDAAAAGILLWNGQPFPIVIDRRGTRPAAFEVRWSTTLGMQRLGVAQTQWSPATGLKVVALQLTTRSTFQPSRVLDPRQVTLTAAHEMGHALGLPHSDQPRDVMYPSNTSTHLTARDYRSLEALYALEDGTRIVR